MISVELEYPNLESNKNNLYLVVISCQIKTSGVFIIYYLHPRNNRQVKREL